MSSLKREIEGGERGRNKGVAFAWEMAHQTNMEKKNPSRNFFFPSSGSCPASCMGIHGIFQTTSIYIGFPPRRDLVHMGTSAPARCIHVFGLFCCRDMCHCKVPNNTVCWKKSDTAQYVYTVTVVSGCCCASPEYYIARVPDSL